METKVIEFHGDKLNALKRENEVFAPAKQICEALGLDWAGQYTRLKKHPVFRSGIELLSIPAIDVQSIIVIRADLIPLWLVQIHPNKVAEAIRDKLIHYQTEAARVLAEAFLEKRERIEGSDPHFIASEYQAAAIITESELRVAQLLGAPQSLARAHAVLEVSKRLPSVNHRPLLAHNPEETQELDLIPTNIAHELGLKSAREANQLLMARGYQSKSERADTPWEITEKGKQFGTYHRTAKHRSNGTPIQQIKWKKSILNFLKGETHE